MTAQTLDELLRLRATALSDKPCVQTPDGASGFSYAELDRRAFSIAAILRERGCRAGDRVILGFSNTPDFFAALFGCFRGGVIAVPLDPNLTAKELHIVIDHADPTAIIADESTKSRFEHLDLRRELLTLGEDRDLAANLIPDNRRDPPPAMDIGPASAETLALILYTSGTTGDPKGVMHSHAAVMRKIISITKWFGFDESFRSLCLLPSHAAHGLICNSLTTIGYGGTLIITPPYNPALLKTLWTIIDRNDVNTFSSVPAVVRLLLEDARHRGSAMPSSIRFVTCASAPLRAEEVEAFEERFKVPLLNCYGMTEAAGWFACSANTGPPRHKASVGKAIDCEIRAVDANGAALPPGESGELQIKGPSIMIGYYRKDELTREIMQKGWLATGDIGEIDETGAVFLHSRIKEIIIRAGRNIYPAEVDFVLMSHPEVMEGCTVGLKDAILGETVAACVVRNNDSSLTEEALIAHAREHLVAYKCPERILFVEQIPKSSRGKVNRSTLLPLFESCQFPDRH